MIWHVRRSTSHRSAVGPGAWLWWASSYATCQTKKYDTTWECVENTPKSQLLFDSGGRSWHSATQKPQTRENEKSLITVANAWQQVRQTVSQQRPHLLRQPRRICWHYSGASAFRGVLVVDFPWMHKQVRGVTDKSRSFVAWRMSFFRIGSILRWDDRRYLSWRRAGKSWSCAILFTFAQVIRFNVESILWEYSDEFGCVNSIMQRINSF